MLSLFLSLFLSFSLSLSLILSLSVCLSPLLLILPSLSPSGGKLQRVSELLTDLAVAEMYWTTISRLVLRSFPRSGALRSSFRFMSSCRDEGGDERTENSQNQDRVTTAHLPTLKQNGDGAEARNKSGAKWHFVMGQYLSQPIKDNEGTPERDIYK